MLGRGPTVSQVEQKVFSQVIVTKNTRQKKDVAKLKPEIQLKTYPRAKK